MRVGILDAIPPSPNGLDWGGTPAERYVQFLRDAGAEFDFAGYAVALGELPASPDACDGYVITGSPRGVYDDDPWIAALSHFLREAYAAGVRLVGICFGHQILAHALGGHAEKSENGRGLGLKPFSMTATRPWMKDAPEECALYFAHQDQVTKLPPGAERLAGSAFCSNAMFVIGEQVLGVQGHPEFSTRMMREILESDNERAPAPVVEVALRSLDEGQPDADLFGRWLVAFLAAP